MARNGFDCTGGPTFANGLLAGPFFVFLLERDNHLFTQAKNCACHVLISHHWHRYMIHFINVNVNLFLGIL